MYTVFLSPSTQEFNPYATLDNDALYEPYNNYY